MTLARILCGATFALSLTGCMASRVDLSPIAAPLGVAPTANGVCAHDAPSLGEATLARWSTSPNDARPYASEFACVALHDNLADDSMSDCMPTVDDAFTPQLGASTHATRRIAGEHSYMHVAPREYAYDLSTGATLDVQVRVLFTGALAHDPRVLEAMQTKLAQAAALWTAYAPRGSMRFRFGAVTSELDSPHFVVELAPGQPRKPYDETWGAEWPWHLIAHEVGHMMGLDDEYPQIRKTVGHAMGKEPKWRADRAVRMDWLRCDLGSLMCDSKGDDAMPQAHHYYAIARRRFCRNVAEQMPSF